MLNPSNRGLNMPASPIRKLVPFAEEAKKKGIKVHHMNIGQPDIETPPSILQAVKDTNIKVLEYSHSAGNESYRKKLVGYYKKLGLDIAPGQIMITSGGSEGIIFGMMACLDPGDELIVPEPFYANYNGFALMAGIKIVPITSKIETGFALPPIADFEKLITAKTKGILICNPNNPTGYVYSKEEMISLEDICLKHQLFLFSDEAYREFCYEGIATSAIELNKIQDQVIIFDTISTGALSDLEKVTKQARAMVTIYGLNEKLGNITYYDSSGQSEYSFSKPYSEDTAITIDKEISLLIEGQYQRAINILQENKDKLLELADILIDKEVIFKDDLETIFGKRPYQKDPDDLADLSV